MKYASDPYWGEKAAAHAYYIEDMSGIVKSTQSNIVVDTGNTMIKVYRNPSTTSKVLYRTGSYDNRSVSQFPFLIIGVKETSEGTFYKIKTDGILKSTRSSLSTAKTGVYSSYNYAYIKAGSHLIFMDNMTGESVPNIYLDKTSHTMYRCGYYQIKASCSNSNQKITYQSNDETLASVSASGKVYAKAAGTVKNICKSWWSCRNMHSKNKKTYTSKEYSL